MTTNIRAVSLQSIQNYSSSADMNARKTSPFLSFEGNPNEVSQEKLS